MKLASLAVLSAAAAIKPLFGTGAETGGTPLHWQQLTPVPDKEGVAGAFAGTSHGALVVAGGANIEGKKWGAHFNKVWHDKVFILESSASEWRTAELPFARGYGVSVNVGERIICMGGSDANGHFKQVFSMEWRGHGLLLEAMPPLPQPCANACGAVAGRTIYLAGGSKSPASTNALKTFWALDLDAKVLKWRKLPPWPGKGRMLAMAGTSGESFFLFGGVGLSADKNGKPARRYFRDAYRYTPNKGWHRLADLPCPLAGAPSPAPLYNGSLLIISGDDGRNVHFEPVRRHPGFSREVIGYDIVRNRWFLAGKVPFSRATAPTTNWNGDTIVANGEERPRVRSHDVWALCPP